MRKVFILIISIFTMFLIVGCSKKEDPFNKAYDKLTIYGDLEHVVDALDLPTQVDGYQVSWQSSNPKVVTDLGYVFRQDKDTQLVLYAYITDGVKTRSKEFKITVLEKEIDSNGGNGENGKTPDSDQAILDAAVAYVSLPPQVISNLTLVTSYQGVSITWTSDSEEAITNEGVVTRGSTDKTVTLTANFNYKTLEELKTYQVVVLKEEYTGEDYTGYYQAASGKTGVELKKALHTIISGHTTYSYKSLNSYLKETDEDPNNPNNMILMYTGISHPKNGSQIWNKEHTWPKSHGNFGTGLGAGSDMHHLRPTVINVNSSRGNLDFDEGGTKVESSEGYAPGSSFCYRITNVSFEPRDEVKGDVARMMFYMATRYDGGDGGPDLELNDRTGNGSAPYLGRISALLKWHEEDPVNDFERKRNDTIYGYQENRNPFVDHPEFVNSIWGTKDNLKPLIKSNNDYSFVYMLIKPIYYIEEGEKDEKII
jgi:endonuclease I